MKKRYIVIIPVVGFAMLILLGIGLSTPYINRDVEAINGLTNFVVLHDGTLYKARFTLVDNEGYVAASDGKVHAVICGAVYNFPFIADEFQQYKLQLTGQPIVAYAWTMQDSDIHADGMCDATITVTLSNGKSFETNTTVFA
jgi:hypothetical protein